MHFLQEAFARPSSFATPRLASPGPACPVNCAHPARQGSHVIPDPRAPPRPASALAPGRFSSAFSAVPNPYFSGHSCLLFSVTQILPFYEPPAPCSPLDSEPGLAGRVRMDSADSAPVSLRALRSLLESPAALAGPRAHPRTPPLSDPAATPEGQDPGVPPQPAPLEKLFLGWGCGFGWFRGLLGRLGLRLESNTFVSVACHPLPRASAPGAGQGWRAPRGPAWQHVRACRPVSRAARPLGVQLETPHPPSAAPTPIPQHPSGKRGKGKGSLAEKVAGAKSRRLFPRRSSCT